MLACLILIVSSILAFVGFKKGFYVMFATLFNLMFAIFISVLSTRLFVSLSPGFEHSGYYAAASILLMFGLIFGLLQTVAWIFFFRYREDYFPALFDKVGSVILGFLCGYVVCILLILALCVTPCSKRGKMNWLCDHEKMQRRGKTGVVTVCKFLAEYSLQCFIGDRAEQEIDFLLKLDRSVEEKKEDSSLLLPEDRLSEEIE
jgi:hypothetical protein